MNSIDFCYWLQGYFELSETKTMSEREILVLKNHLNLVFVHEIDPLRESQTSTTTEVLDTTHSGNDLLMRC